MLSLRQCTLRARNITEVIKSWRMRLVEHISFLREMRNIYILSGGREDKLGRHKH
jgi:hypothetical protein